MARARRKPGGPTRGRFKRKRMGKGYNAHRRVSVHALPIDRDAQAQAKAKEERKES